VSLSPNYAYAFALRANCYVQLNEPAKAVVDFDEALKLFPKKEAKKEKHAGMWETEGVSHIPARQISHN